MAATIRTDKIGPVSGSADFTLPTADGSAKSALITDGSKALSFATGTPSASNFLRGDGTWAAAGEDNTPAFFAYLTANQTVTDNTITKLQCDGELFDTATAYDKDTNYRFTVPAGEGGKYVVTTQISFINGNNSGISMKAMIYVGGVEKAHSYAADGSSWYWEDNVLMCQTILVLSATNYVEAYGTWNTGSGGPGFGGNASSMSSYFSAFKLAGV